MGQPAVALVGLAAIASMVGRYRASRGALRQQLKWVTYGAALSLTTWVLHFFTGPGGPFAAVFTVLGLWAIPAAIGIAVLRYRLYEHRPAHQPHRRLRGRDRGPRRGLRRRGVHARPPARPHRRWLRPGGRRLHPRRRRPLRPARRRTQALVDLHFDRARYSATRTVDAYRATLRDELDLDSLNQGLLAAVHHTVQPTRADLWLRDRA